MSIGEMPTRVPEKYHQRYLIFISPYHRLVEIKLTVNPLSDS